MNSGAETRWRQGKASVDMRGHLGSGTKRHFHGQWVLDTYTLPCIMPSSLASAPFCSLKEAEKLENPRGEISLTRVEVSKKIGSSRMGFAAAWELRFSCQIRADLKSQLPPESQESLGLKPQVSGLWGWETRVMWDPDFWFTANSTSLGFCLCLLKQIKCHIWVFLWVRLRGFFIVSGEALLWVSLSEHGRKNTPCQAKVH